MHWTAVAFNQAPDAPNGIHTDKGAKTYGFEGGLVLGAAIGAFLTYPAVEAWGLDFLTHGRANVRIVSPLYDAEVFVVETSNLTQTGYSATLFRPDRTVSAKAEVCLAKLQQLSTPPVMRGDPLGDKDTPAVAANPESMARLKETGCYASRFHWQADHRLRAYLKSSADIHPLLRVGEGGDGFANMSFILGCANVILARAVYMKS